MFQIAIFNGREILPGSQLTLLPNPPALHARTSTTVLNMQVMQPRDSLYHSLSRRPNGMAPTGGGLRFIRKPSAAPEMLCQLHRSRASHTASHPYGTVSQEAVAAAA